MGPLFVCVVGPMLVTMPVWRSAAVRFGKKPCLVAASLIYVMGVSGVLMLPAVPETVRFGVACAACLVAGIGYSGVQLLPQAMLADTWAAYAAESRQRRAGLLSGLWSAAETVSSAGISVLAIIAALTLLAGYTLTEDQAEELVLARQHEGCASPPTSARSS